MHNSTPTFDIRRLIANAELDNPLLQAGYDTLNRMVAMTEDIPFRELFMQPWTELMPRLQANIAAVPSLFPDAEKVNRLLDDLARGDTSQGSFHSFLDPAETDSEDAEPPAAQETVLNLWRQGIYLAIRTGRPRRDCELQASLENLVQNAGHLTYRSLYETCKCCVSEETLSAVHDAIDSGLIFVAANDRCCDHRSGSNPACIIHVGSSCTCVNGGTGECGSQGCTLASIDCDK